MAELEVLKVDVFTEELLTGNPVGVVLDADTLDEVQMQSIAFENGSPESAFVLRSRKADIRLRFFTPFSEEPLSGHATIGAIWCLAERQAFGAATGGKQRLETAAGVLPFSIESTAEGVRRVWMTQKRPMFAREGDVKEVASALGVGVDSLFHDEFPISRVSTGLPCLVVPVRSIDVIQKMEPKRDEMTMLSRELDVAGFEVFSWNVIDRESTVHARFFVPLPGMHEDPASGLPAGALGAYLVENDFIPKEKHDRIIIEQGHWISRPSRIYVRIEKKGQTIHKVEVGGAARISMRGRISVD